MSKPVVKHNPAVVRVYFTIQTVLEIFRMNKLKKGYTYDAIYISDIHYLVDVKIKMNSHSELFALLDELEQKNVTFRSVFLVGDIIENWFFSSQRKIKKTAEQKRLHKLFDRFDKIAAPGGEKIYIIGNHDSTSYRLRLPSRIRAFLEERKWQIMEKFETPNMIVVHGHQGQYGAFIWTLNVFLTRVVHTLAHLIPGILYLGEAFFRQYINYDRDESHESVIRFYASLSARLHQGDRILICGHTHQFLGSSTMRVINTGDWIDSRSFVVQEEDVYTGYQYIREGKIKEHYRIKLTEI